MRRHRQSFWTNSLLSVGFSSLCGLLCSAVCITLFSAFIFFLMDDWKLIRWFSSAALIISAFCASYICGKFRRRKGLAEGALCGLFMYAVLAVCGFAALGKPAGIGKLLLLGISGAAGGVFGVNSKRPSKLRD